MTRLTGTIWYTAPVAETDRPVLAIIVGSARALMIDGGNCPHHAREFLRELKEHGVAEADFIATTHSHCDHVFGLSSLTGMIVSNSATRANISRMNGVSWNDAEVAARVHRGIEHEMTARMLKDEMPGDRTGFRIREPQIVYETSLVIDLGETTCRIERIGGAHAADSTIIFVPEQRVAFIGDCLYVDGAHGAAAASLLERLLALDADLYVDSHRAQPLSRKQLESGEPVRGCEDN